MRSTLLAALLGCADKSRRSVARQFLGGLSSDELQFIAEFVGSSILESRAHYGCSRAELVDRIFEFQSLRSGCPRWPSHDQQHKMILLLEYLSQCGHKERRFGRSATATSC